MGPFGGLSFSYWPTGECRENVRLASGNNKNKDNKTKGTEKMSKELKEAYALLRAKDEVTAEWPSSLVAALCVAAIGIAAIIEGAWTCAIIALSAAALFSMWNIIFAKVADWCIRRRGYTEIELERLDLA